MSKKIIPFERSFASHVLKDCVWSDKNELKPHEVSKNSHTEFYFDCTVCNHEYERSPNTAVKNCACSYCAHLKVCSSTECTMCFKNSFASHNLKGAIWSNKNELKPRQVIKASRKEFYFNCTVCDHEYKRTLCNAVKNKACPFCTNVYLCADSNCTLCYDKSFATSSKSELWSPKNTEKPRDNFINSFKKFLFDCDECDHTYTMALNHASSGKGCGYCYGALLCDDNDCNTCKDKSFASHKKANLWSKKNKKTARQTRKNSGKQAFFDCDKCNHTFDATIGNVTNGSYCPYCAHKCLCDNKNCIDCFNNSFASVEKSKYWSDKNKVKPRNYFKSTNVKCIFNCPDCNNEYIAMLSDVTTGYWCGCINNKTETKLFDWCKKNLNQNIEHPKKFDWCKNKTYLPFDFCIDNLKLIIELDGRQHFEQVQNWSSPEEQEKNDRYKMTMANKHGYSIIRICQETVWSDKDDWKEKLKLAVKKYEKITNVFIGNVYNTAKIIKDHKYSTVLVK